MSAQKAVQTGVPQLVPPISYAIPPTSISAPWFGSAAAATSGTHRIVPLGTPVPICQDGRLNTALTPPPLSDQAVSPVTVLVVVSNIRLVPPTPVTSGSHVG